MGAEGRGKGVPDWGNGMDQVLEASELADWQADETEQAGGQALVSDGVRC